MDFSLLKEIFAFSIFIAINQIIDIINWQTDKIILGRIVNGTAVAVYAVGANINTMFTSISTSVSNVYIPQVNQIVSAHSIDTDPKLTRLFIRVGRVQWFVLMLVLTGFIFFGQYFIFRWAGEEYRSAYVVALLLMTPAIVPLIQNIGIEVQRAKNKHQFRSIVYLFMAILNVFISIIFCNFWGEIGAALGTTISLIVANGFIMNAYYHKRLGINVISFWKSIARTFPAFILPTLFGIAIMVFYRFNSLIDFFILVSVYAIVYLFSVFFFGLDDVEKKQAVSVLKKIIKMKG